MVVYKTTNLLTGIIYVGKDGNDNPSYLGSGLHLKRAVKKYGRENFKKEILEICDGNNWTARERHWIAVLDARNPEVGYNITEGGEGWTGLTHSVETRLKISQAKKGCAGTWNGRHHTQETKLKISQTSAGRLHTPEAKAKISNTCKGKIFSDETKQRISIALTGKRLSAETREKIAIAHRGKKLSEEHKRKISANSAMTGTTHSDATKQKVSESLRRYHAARKAA